MESPNTDLYPRFSDVEVGRRRVLVRDFVEHHHLDGLVVFGWSAQNRTAQADVYYLSGYLGMRDNYVVFSSEGETTLFAQSYNHVPNATEVSFLDDVRWGGADNGKTVGEEIGRGDSEMWGGRMDAVPAVRIDAADDRRRLPVRGCHPWRPQDQAQEER